MKLKNLLQLFANANTQTTTTTNIKDEIKTFYDKNLIRLAEAENVFDQFGQDCNIPKGNGHTIEKRKFDSLATAMTPLTEGVTPDGNNLKVTTVTGTVSQYGDYITLSDRIQMEAIDPIVTESLDLLGSQAGRTSNQVTRDVISGGTNVMWGNGKASRSALTADDTLTVAIIRKAVTALKKAHAPKINGSYVCIIHPDVSEDLRNSDGWTDIHKYADVKPIFTGEIGELEGVRFIENTEAKIWNDSTKDNTPSGLAVYACYFIGSGAYAKTGISGGGLQTIVKPLGSGEDPLNQRSTVGWKLTKGAMMLVQQYMMRVEVCSSYSATATAN